MCLSCGAWTSEASRLLAIPCDPLGMTKARSNGKTRFLNGMRPCKSTSLQREDEAKQEWLQLELAKIHTPVLSVKRVAQALNSAAKLAKKPKSDAPSQSHECASSSRSEMNLHVHEPVVAQQNPAHQHDTIVQDKGVMEVEVGVPTPRVTNSIFDDAEGDPWFGDDFRQDEDDEMLTTPSSSSAFPSAQQSCVPSVSASVRPKAKAKRKKPNKGEVEAQRVQALSRIVSRTCPPGLKSRLQRPH